MSKVLNLGVRKMGPGAPCLIAAEIGLNHNGSLSLAKEMLVAAAEAGADAVKFQNYRTEDFLSDTSLTYTYKSRGETITESQWAMFKRCEPTADFWPPLKALCDELGVVFFSTPTGPDGVDELVSVGAGLIKNGSDYLTHTPLLEKMGRTGIPVVISTGMADAEDIDEGVAAVRRGGRSELVILHCTSAYPTPPASVNLQRMTSLQKRYDALVGFSDHTVGAAAAVQAVTLGAVMVEKHFTLDHNLPGPDQWFSSTPAELRQLVDAVREAESRMGSGAIVPADIESAGRREYRLSVVAASNLGAGSRFAVEHAAFRRPGYGIPPKDVATFYGRVLRRDVPRGEPLRAEDFEPR